MIDNSAEYKNGDFNGYFINGEQYYFSVTAVYRDKTVAGNTIRCTYVGEDSPVLFPAPEVSTAYEDGRLVVKWNKLNSPLLTEYRVVISKNKENPVYPADGYYDKAYDKDTHRLSSTLIRGITTGIQEADLRDGILYKRNSGIWKQDCCRKCSQGPLPGG